MPHVRRREYPVPSSEYTLEYVEVMHRHHKRTPYASNTFFKEDVGWNCVNEGTLHYGKNASGVASQVSPISWQGYTDSHNPFTYTVGPGFENSTCAFPQITAEGLEDSHQHGLVSIDISYSCMSTHLALCIGSGRCVWWSFGILTPLVHQQRGRIPCHKQCKCYNRYQENFLPPKIRRLMYRTSRKLRAKYWEQFLLAYILLVN